MTDTPIVSFNAFRLYSPRIRDLFRRQETFYLGSSSEPCVEVLFTTLPDYIHIRIAELQRNWAFVHEAIMQGAAIKTERAGNVVYLRKAHGFVPKENPYLKKWQLIKQRLDSEKALFSSEADICKGVVEALYPFLEVSFLHKRTKFCNVYYLRLSNSHYLRRLERMEMSKQIYNRLFSCYGVDALPVRIMWDN